MIRTLVVDDEPLAIEAVVSLLAGEADVEIVGRCLNGREAVDAIRALRPDLVLLDVQMPVFDGFEVIEELEFHEIPIVVFVTAFDQYALRAFAVHAVDYLLKPIEPERLGDSMTRVREVLAGRRRREHGERLAAMLEALEARRTTLERFVVRDRDRVRFIRAQEVDAIEAAGVYVVLHRGEDVFVLRDALSAIGGRLNPERFLRVHRGWIVNVDRIAEIRGRLGPRLELRLASGLAVPVSRRHRAAVVGRVGRAEAR